MRTGNFGYSDVMKLDPEDFNRFVQLLDKTPQVPEAYTQYLSRFAPYLGYFVTLTQKDSRYQGLYVDAVRFTWNLNRSLGLKRRDGLLTVFTLETKPGPPHIHFLTENNPHLTPGVILNTWGRSTKRLALTKCQDIQRIPNGNMACERLGYAFKHTTWETEPFIFIPQRLQEVEVRE